MVPTPSHRYFASLTRYDAWVNERLYEAVARLFADEYREVSPRDRDELIRLLNRLPVGGRLWFARWRGYAAGVDAIDEHLYDVLDSIREAQLADDIELYGYAHTLAEEDMLRPIPYQGCDATAHANSLQEILAQLFTQKARSQGRICELLSQLGAVEPDLDYVCFLRQAG